MLADIRSRADYLRLADVVIRDEDNLQKVANLRVLVHYIGHIVDEMDDGLRHPVTRGCLASENRNPRHHFLLLFG